MDANGNAKAKAAANNDSDASGACCLSRAAGRYKYGSSPSR